MGDHRMKVPSFKDAVALAQAVEEVTREEFLDAQRRVRPEASYKGYTEGLWQPWKAGGLLWLANRTNPQEVAEVYVLVVTRAAAFVDEVDNERAGTSEPTVGEGAA